MDGSEFFERHRVCDLFHPAQFSWNGQNWKSSFRSNYISRRNFLNFLSGPGANIRRSGLRRRDFCHSSCLASIGDLGGLNTGDVGNTESRCRSQQLPSVDAEAPFGLLWSCHVTLHLGIKESAGGTRCICR
jgi:hypothetical protein